MSLITEVYTGAGLRGVLELYALFPERLRTRLVSEHAELFRRLWRELTPEERKGLEEYSLVESPSEQVGVENCQAKLRDLKEGYGVRRSKRLNEVMALEPEIAEALLMDFEKAYRSLTAIHEQQLLQAQTREIEQAQREEEAAMFEPSEHSGLVTIPL